MLFSIHDAAVNAGERVYNALDLIIARVESAIHEIEIPSADLLQESEWYKSCRADRRKMLEQIAQSQAYRTKSLEGPHLRQIDVGDEASAICAQALAYTPLTILLENGFSDGALVNAAIEVVAKPQTIELCFGRSALADPPALELVGGGGHGELLKLLALRLNEAKERNRPCRLLVVTDSDGEWPGDVKDHALTIRKTCRDHSVPCPNLSKRTAENYIPDAIWKEWAADPARTAARPMVAALLSLSSAQRDYVNMGKTNDAPWDAQKANVALVFADVLPETEAVLKAANLKGRGTSMSIYLLKTYKAVLTSQVFKSRDSQDELLSLVRQIENEL